MDPPILKYIWVHQENCKIAKNKLIGSLLEKTKHDIK